MKTILLSLIAVASLMVGLVPVAAAPLRVTVHGATPIYPPAPTAKQSLGNAGDPLDIYDPLNLYPNEFDRGFDAASSLYEPHYTVRPSVDLVLARTLDRTGESIARHIEICQAHYRTYDLISNTYEGPSGLPNPCLL